MFKNLAPSILGLTCSQSELIELALTHKFRGLHLDFGTFQSQVQRHGVAYAVRYLKNSPLKVTSSDLPVDLAQDESSFKAQLEMLPSLIEPLGMLGCTTLHIDVLAGSDTLAYHENFEMHRQRLAAIADALKPHEMKLAIGFQLLPLNQPRPAISFIREPQALVALLKMTNATNLSLVIDTWCWTVAQGAFDFLSGLNADRIAEVRLADVPADYALDQARPEDRLLYGTTGVIDGSRLYELLQGIGFRGAVTPYMHASQFSGMGRDETVRRAAESVDIWLASGQREPATS